MKNKFIIISLLAITTTGCVTNTLKKNEEIKSVKATFLEYCKNPQAFKAEKLMKYLHPKKDESCEAAKIRLEKVTNINLKHLEITDLSPITVFKNAEIMSLSFNPITNLTPLLELKKLKVLFIRHISLGDKVPKTEENCPTKDGVFKTIKKFCLKK